MHVGKLPPALPVLREAFGIGLVQAGFLLSTVQLGSMLLGLALGLAAVRLGLRQGLLAGLALLAVASAAGALSGSATTLLLWRAVEGVGVLLVAVSAPSLLRSIVPPARLNLRLGLWGTYMPGGTGLALLIGPLAMAVSGWSGWWLALAALTAGVGWAAGRRLGWADPAVALPGGAPSRQPAGAGPPKAFALLGETLRRPAPWLLAACFGLYSGQWLTVIGFLPTVYAEAGLSPAVAGALTAAVALANVAGNVAGGQALHRGMPPVAVMLTGFAVMGLGAVVAFGLQDRTGLALRFAAVVAFSLFGGLVPSTLFALAARASPSPAAMPVMVGLLTHGTATGQFLGPPAAAAWAAAVGGWSQTWVVTGGCALAGAVVALALGWALPSYRSAVPGRDD